MESRIRSCHRPGRPTAGGLPMCRSKATSRRFLSRHCAPATESRSPAKRASTARRHFRRTGASWCHAGWRRRQSGYPYHGYQYAQTRRLTTHRAIDTEGSWSPDGRHIYFTSDRSGGPQIYRVSATGGTPERITFEGSYNARPRLSADGTRLAMVHIFQGNYRIAVMDMIDENAGICWCFRRASRTNLRVSRRTAIP